MKNKKVARMSRGDFFHWAIASIALCAWVFAGQTLAKAQDNKKGKDDDIDAGVMLKTHATAKEVGLPIYPGSRPHKDDSKDSQAVQMGLWGSSFGFKLVVLKMESDDAPEKIATYYRRELARYGKVLNCTGRSGGEAQSEKTKSSDELTCEDDDGPEKKDGQVYKAGTKERHHIVGIQPEGKGSLFQLVYVEAREEKKPL